MKIDGNNLEQTESSGSISRADASVVPVNLWLHSLFSHVDVSLNDRLLTPSMNTYLYWAYLGTLLSYGPAAKESYLSAALWSKDTKGHMKDSSNEGMKGRQKWTLASKEVTTFGRPHLDLCFQDRLLLNGIDVKMRFVRSKDAFCVMGDAHVKIKDISLFVHKVKVHPSVQLGHIKEMERATAKYPIRRIETKAFSIPKSNLMVNQENLFLGQLPKRIVIGIVENLYFNGHVDKNPFNFSHFNVNYNCITCGWKTDSQQTFDTEF